MAFIGVIVIVVLRVFYLEAAYFYDSRGTHSEGKI